MLAGRKAHELDDNCATAGAPVDSGRSTFSAWRLFLADFVIPQALSTGQLRGWKPLPQPTSVARRVQHMTTTPVESSSRRRHVRLFAAAIAGLIAILYTLIAFNIVHVVELAPGERSPQLYFGLRAALAFLFGAFLLLRKDHRWLWITGVVLQVLVIWTYLSVAPDRVPSFEIWGVLIRIAQVPLLAALTYLAVTSPHPMTTSRGQLA